MDGDEFFSVDSNTRTTTASPPIPMELSRIEMDKVEKFVLHKMQGTYGLYWGAGK